MNEGQFSHSYSSHGRPWPDVDRPRRKALLAFAVLCNLALVLMECIAFAALWRAHPVFRDQVIFYTNLSNFLTLLCSALFVLSGTASLFGDGRMPHGIEVFRLVCTVQLYITWLVIFVGAVPLFFSSGPGSLAAMYGGSMFVMHFLAPVVSLVSFVFLEGTPRLTRRDAFLGVLPTYLYTLVLVPLNAFGVVEGPYPFLQVDTNPLWLSLVYAVLFLPGDYLVSLCGKWLHNGIACRIAGEIQRSRN